ncbi:MAG: hypothetical protein IJJ33_18465 [Victivallales bacterium]|nr:hypothetical protein [Victivallales bacterium]
MAKTPISTQPLTFVEIVMRANTETIRKALEAREKIDTLLVQREEAYRRIAALEAQVDEVMGGAGQFVFPEPPLPVAGFGGRPAVAPKKPASAPAKADKEPAEPVAEGGEKKPVIKKEE